MSDKDSDAPRPFVESDDAATVMDYDEGKLPIYVVIVWAIALISFAAYMISYAMPDLSAWGSP